MRRARAALLLALAGLGLVCAFGLQGWMDAWNLAYYGLLGVPPGNVYEEGRVVGTMAMGACDLFMYQGSRSLHGFLAFLLLYGGYVAVGLLLVGRAPEAGRRPLLLAWSLLFLFIVLTPAGAVRVVELVLALFLAARLPWSGRVRGLALVGILVAWLPLEGRGLLEVCAGEWLRSHFLGADLSFPRLFVAMALLVKTFRRVLWLAYETANGRADLPDVQDFLLYFLGLPFLIGNGVTPPFRGFVESRGRGPGFAEGAATVAWCLGLAPVLLTLLVMSAYSPAVRLFFPHCDLHFATGPLIWARYLVTYPVEFLFLLASEQASVGVARLFGYGLKDNYAAPLLAPDPASWWRRWNIYWRDYLVAAFFYPAALALARRQGGRRTWHLAAAAGLTFLATWMLNLAPLALLGGFAEEAVEWTPLVASLALYYGLEGAAVALVLVHEALRKPGARRLPAWLGVAGTFLFIAAARGFLNPEFDVAEQLELLLRALGVEVFL